MSPDTMIYVKIGGKKYTLPVNPEEIEVSHPHVDKTAEIAGLGEILIPQKPGLREVTFNSFSRAMMTHTCMTTATPGRLQRRLKRRGRTAQNAA